MMPLDLLLEIKRRRDLRQYYSIVFEFLGYLNATRSQRFRFRGVDFDDNGNLDCITSEVEYVHRWTLPYVNGWKAKLYLADEWYKAQGSPPFEFASLTTYQAGKYSMKAKGRAISIHESFQLQKRGFYLLKKLITNDYGKFDYISIIEPHLKNDTGYPHTHVPIFIEIDDRHKEKYVDAWSDRYEIGSQEHGLVFSEIDEGRPLQSFRNYMMKYLSKGFLSIGSKFGDAPVTAGHLVFHAIVWKFKYRIFGASQALSKVMAWNPSRKPLDWLSTSILKPSGEEALVWMAEDREGMVKMKDFVEEQFGVEFENVG